MGTLQIKVERPRCVGHARCNAVAPSLMTLDDDGYSDIDVKAVPPDMRELARRVVRACPEGAISIVEEG